MKNKLTFITGIGRSGTTIFYKVLSHHPEVYWLSPFADKYPTKPAWNNFVVNNIDSWMPSYFRKRIEPVECYQFFNQSYRGFSRPFRDLTASDATERSKKMLHQSFQRFDTGKKPHLTVKVTGWPRIGFLQETFPDAKFVHIKREGKATVNSFLNVHFWHGWHGPENWRWGPLTAEQDALWAKHNRSFVALAAIQYLIYMEAFDKARQLLPAGNVLEIKYEDFVEDPVGQLYLATDFMGIGWDKKFEKAIHKYQITDSNVKWKKDLTPMQQQQLHDILDPHLSKYGY